MRGLGPLLLVLASCSSSTPVPDVAADLAADLGRPDARADARADARREARGPDSFVPLTLELTVNRIPVAMNGSVPFTNKSGALESFRLAVPRSGFSVDVTWRGSTARPETLKVVADLPLGSGATAIPAGSDLAPRFAREPEAARWLVPAELAAAPGPIRFKATLGDGAQTLESSLEVEAVERTFLLDPFRLEDTWLLVFSQDLYTLTRTTSASGAIELASSAQPNGLADFEEDLRAVGLGSAQMLPAAAALTRDGVTGTNAILRRWLEREIVGAVRKAYLLGADGATTPDSVRVRFVAEYEPGAPKLANYQQQTLKGGETAKAFSAIAIGGGDVGKALLGLSKTLDERNLTNEKNTGPTYGVFTSRAIATLLELLGKDAMVKGVFKVLFGDFVPELGLGGKPVGEHTLDAEILAAGFDPKQASPAAAARHQKLRFIVETLGRLCGALTAHEIGHSLGLVADGPPPHGHFGGESKASFVNGARTTTGHIDTPGFNLMEAGPGSAPNAPLDPLQYLTEPRFNELNLAYLQGRVLLLP
jgi:hypothetical protein